MRIATLGILALALVTCGPSIDAAATGHLECGPPTTLTTAPGILGPGAVAGPVLFRAFTGTDATIRDWRPGTIQKVLIVRTREASPELTIRGRRCADGHELHFWYRGGAPFSVTPSSTPIPDTVLDSIGDAPLVLPAFEGASFEVGVPGYMLFTSEGDWRIEVSAGGKSLGSAVLRVTTAP